MVPILSSFSKITVLKAEKHVHVMIVLCHWARGGLGFYYEVDVSFEYIYVYFFVTIFVSIYIHACHILAQRDVSK